MDNNNREEKKTRKEKFYENAYKSGKLSTVLGAGLLGLGLLSDRINDPSRPSNKNLDPEYYKKNVENGKALKKNGLIKAAIGLGILGFGRYQHYKYKKRKDDFQNKKNNSFGE